MGLERDDRLRVDGPVENDQSGAGQIFDFLDLDGQIRHRDLRNYGLLAGAL
jgi:hypothetical protein